MAKRRQPRHAWLPLFTFPTLTLLFRDEVPPWIFMWALAASIFAGCKWLVYCEGIAHVKAPFNQRIGFLLLWPGMDVRTFLTGPKPPCPSSREWSFAGVKLLFGAFLYWRGGRLAGDGDLLAGWCGMIGLIFMLHFGSFHLLTLAWRSMGVNAQPLMKNPAAAVSVAEFWSRRWNAAFNDIAQRFVFQPLVRWAGVGIATFAAFGFSGFLHDLVISIPAQGGYGLPSGYFLLQALGVLIERSKLGRVVGLRRGLRGWFFTVAFTAGPAFWLFHPTFVRRIVLPMMEATGAL